MMIEVKLDRGTCQGYGNCVLIAPDLFELDPDGVAVVNAALVPDARLRDLQTAVYDCPTNSISLVEDASASGAASS
jgi:ferredoxin